MLVPLSSLEVKFQCELVNLASDFNWSEIGFSLVKVFAVGYRKFFCLFLVRYYPVSSFPLTPSKQVRHNILQYVDATSLGKGQLNKLGQKYMKII